MTTTPLVAVLLGTDHHPFDRLVGWASDAQRLGRAEWFVQHGETSLPPELSGSPMLAVEALESLLRRADAVVTHGGPGLIMEARAVGHLPVVVPRDPARGEHVDDHQIHFTRRLADGGLIDRATDEDSFQEAVARQVARGRTREVSRGSGHDASIRLGELVDDLLSARTRRGGKVWPRRRRPR